MERGGSYLEIHEDDGRQLLRDLFRLSVISIAETEEQLAKDLELFAHHGNRKSINMDDVILSAHRNEHVATLLRSISQEYEAKEPQSEKKRKRSSKKDGRGAAADVLDLS